MDDQDPPPKRLHVENLALALTEDLLHILFSQFGSCVECKVTRGVDHDPYAFVEFAEPKHAQEALKAMNERNVLGQELKVSWASQSETTSKQDATDVLA